MFSCRDATNLMTEEREGRLAGGTRFKYACHMIICGHCRAFRRQLVETIAIVKEIPREEIPAKTEDEIVAAFRARANRGEPPR